MTLEPDLDLTPRPAVSFVVDGQPAPQGSKNCGCRGGRAVMFEQTSKSLKPWRKAVAAAAALAMGDRPVLDGPLRLAVIFTMPRPAKPKYPTAPAVAPDLSKLLRSTEDALTGVVWRDDCLVVSVTARKVYVGDHDALPHPGAVVDVSTAP